MTEPGPPSRPRASVAVAALVFAALGTSLPQATFAPIIGRAADSFDATAAGTSWGLTIVLVVAAATTPLIGRLGDRFGPRRVLLILLPVVALGLAIAGLAPDLGWLIAGRALQGLGGGAFPLAVAIVRRVVPGRRRATAIGLVTAALWVGIGFGVVIAGVVVEMWGMRGLSWVPFGFVVASELLVLLAVPAVPTVAGARGRPLGVGSTLLLALGVVAVMLAVTQAPRWPHPLAWIGGCLFVGSTAIFLWVRHERRSDDPLIGAHTLRGRAVWATHLTALLLGAAMLGAFVLLPLFAEAPSRSGEGLDASVTVAGLLLLPASLAMLAVGGLAGPLRRLLGTRGPVLLGAAVSAIGGLVMLLAPHEIPVLMAGSALLGAGIATSSAGMINVLVDVVPGSEVGVSTAFNVVARQLGGALGAAFVAGVVVGAEASGGGSSVYAAAFSTVAVLTVAGLFAALLIPSQRVRAA